MVDKQISSPEPVDNIYVLLFRSVAFYATGIRVGACAPCRPSDGAAVAAGEAELVSGPTSPLWRDSDGAEEGFLSSIIATQRKSSVFSRTIFSIIVRGTDSSMPNGPQTQPQNTRDRRMTRGDNWRRRPNSIGSTKLPNTMLIAR